MAETSPTESNDGESETEIKETDSFENEAYITDQTIAMYFWAMKKLLPRNSKYHSTD